MSETLTATPISLEAKCGIAGCAEWAGPLYLQLREGYETCSVMPIPETVAEWREEHRTARKRANKCRELGYRFAIVKRHRHADEILKINTSKAIRQKRPMSAGYSVRPSETPDPFFKCRRHGVHAYGVLGPAGSLVAYLWLYRSGQLALVSSILGHAGHLNAGVMYLLFDGVVAFESADPDGYFVYNRADSGTKGLVWFKERLGFVATEVEWKP